MVEGAVVANISSSLGSLDRMMARQSTYYGSAKAPQNALTRQLAAAAQGDGIVAFSVSAGWVQTSMGGTAAPLTAEESARRLAQLLDSVGLDYRGTFRDVAAARFLGDLAATELGPRRVGPRERRGLQDDHRPSRIMASEEEQ